MKSGIAIIFILFLLGCSFPRIYIIDDPLTAQQHNELGFIYESQGKSDLAEKEYIRAAEKEKEWGVPHFNLGNVYFKKGDQEKAETHYRKALERDPENPDFMNNLAYVLYKKGEYDEAETWIDRALSIAVKEEYLDTRNKILSSKRSQPPRSP